MSTAPVKSLIDEQLEQIERSLAMFGAGVSRDLPESMAMPTDRVMMLFKGPTFAAAVHEAELASIENPLAWKCRACICGEWTVGYEVRV
jgi:hypothetical protein